MALQLSGLAEVVREVGVAPGPRRVVIISDIQAGDAAVIDELMAIQLGVDASWEFVNRERLRRMGRTYNLLKMVEAVLPGLIDDPYHASDFLRDMEHKIRTRATFSGVSFRVLAVEFCNLLRDYNDRIIADPPVSTREELQDHINELIAQLDDLLHQTCTLRQDDPVGGGMNIKSDCDEPSPHCSCVGQTDISWVTYFWNSVEFELTYCLAVGGGMKIKADCDESSPYAAMLVSQDVALCCKYRTNGQILGDCFLEFCLIMLCAAGGNKTNTPGPDAQSALRALALARSGMNIGRIGSRSQLLLVCCPDLVSCDLLNDDGPVC
uniref:Uncharacterized protein n=1 Tax=Oryza rufipogon TaxID=4529 RepID=A0A0E0N8M0_ORYRU